jgi:transcriptional regulator with XRE-family HTH domain
MDKAKSDFLKDLGKHLKKIREEKGLSLREVEYRGEATRDLISKIENGLSNPTIYTIKKICEAMEIDIIDLFEDFKRKK